jgi:sec-independent protein translocase protein TatC
MGADGTKETESPREGSEGAAPDVGSGGAEGLLDSARKVRVSVLLYGAAFLTASAASWPMAKGAFGSLSRLAGRPLVAYSPSEPLLALLAMSTGFGLALSFPLLAHLVFRFLSGRFPSAFPRHGILVVPAATLLFLAGGSLAWFLLLPAGVSFLVGFESPDAQALLSIRAFVSFCTTFVVALGLAFEAPLVSLLLARAGILTPALFRKSWRMAIMGCTILAAILTPTPDVYNLALMAFPLLCLYGASFLLVVLFGKKKGDGGETGAGKGGTSPGGEGKG